MLSCLVTLMALFNTPVSCTDEYRSRGWRLIGRFAPAAVEAALDDDLVDVPFGRESLIHIGSPICRAAGQIMIIYGETPERSSQS